jgi:hypothetical protein
MFKYEKPLYSKRESVAKRTKKAKKSLLKIAMADPIMKAIINDKAKSMGVAIAKATGTYRAPPAYEPGMGKAFYKTREWKELRYRTFVKYGRVCQCCGAKDTELHIDHIKPRSRYPQLELNEDNLQILCEPCNIGKSNLDATDWRQQ